MNITDQVHGSERGPAILEPATVPTSGRNHVDWARLLPFNLNNEQLETLLHRSHHAMAYGGMVRMADAMTPGKTVHYFLLWAGFDKDMKFLDDLWVVYVYPAGECAALSRNDWWHSAWCWTARKITQLGRKPQGRAYAQMVVLPVCFVGTPDLLAMWSWLLSMNCVLAVYKYDVL
jgi:hypothetical protein